MAPQIWISIAVSLIAGGACGALLTERFRKKRSRTQRIPLIERVNRNPIKQEIKGIRFFRQVGTQLAEVKSIREYQMTLRNTSETDLRDAELHFEFSGDTVEAWSSRTKLGNVNLPRISHADTDAGCKVVRWQLPQFPSGDSVELSFQVVEPTSEDYNVALYKTNNVVIERRRDETGFGPEFKVVEHLTEWLRALTIVLAVLSAVFSTQSLRELLLTLSKWIGGLVR